jgi:hypothetical protein
MTKRGSPTTTLSTYSSTYPRPQWAWLVLFGVVVAIHQFYWQDTDTLGASLGLAVTVGLVFRTRAAWIWGAVTGATLVAADFWGLVDGRVVFLVGLVSGVVVSALVGVVARRRWTGLPTGPLTAVPAAVDEVEQWWDLDRPEYVTGWAVLPDGLRTRFVIRHCPPEIYGAVLATRTLQVYGEPRLGEVAVGLREGPVSMSLITWGQNVVVQLNPGPQGTMVTVNSTMKFGLFDWGEGKRIGNRFIAAIASTIRVAPYPQA